jgi:hypothetical protein
MYLPEGRGREVAGDVRAGGKAYEKRPRNFDFTNM